MNNFFEAQRLALREGAQTWQNLRDAGLQTLGAFQPGWGGVQGLNEALKALLLYTTEATQIANDQSAKNWLSLAGAAQIKDLGEKNRALCAIQVDLASSLWSTLCTQAIGTAEALAAWTNALASVRDGNDASMAHYELGERLQAITKSALTQQARILAGVQPAALQWLQSGQNQAASSSAKRKETQARSA